MHLTDGASGGGLINFVCGFGFCKSLHTGVLHAWYWTYSLHYACPVSICVFQFFFLSDYIWRLQIYWVYLKIVLQTWAEWIFFCMHILKFLCPVGFLICVWQHDKFTLHLSMCVCVHVRWGWGPPDARGGWMFFSKGTVCDAAGRWRGLQPLAEVNKAATLLAVVHRSHHSSCLGNWEQRVALILCWTPWDRWAVQRVEGGCSCAFVFEKHTMRGAGTGSTIILLLNELTLKCSPSWDDTFFFL